MPNWVFNGLTIEGNPDEVEKLVGQMNKPFAKVEETWDKASNSYIKRTVTYPNPVFAFWNIIKPTDLDTYFNRIVINQTNETFDQTSARMYQDSLTGNDWYNWNIRNWGTKWDVALSGDENVYANTYTEGPVQNGDSKVVYYSFDTAWSPPLTAISTLSLQYPPLLFTLSYEEETGWGGEIEYLNGKMISESTYDSKCNDCDAYDTMEYCEDCENNVCSACGFGNEEAEENKCQTHSVQLATTNEGK